jgi:hypothetical protein
MLTGCATMITTPQNQNNWNEFTVDQLRNKVTLEMKDGSSVTVNTPSESKVTGSKVTGIVQYQNAGFINEPLIGADFIGDNFLLFIGDRFLFVGPFGLHAGISYNILGNMYSNVPDDSPGVCLGIDYKYSNFIFGFNLEQPIAYPRQNVRGGCLLTFSL